MKNPENWRRRLVTASGIAAAGVAFALPAMADQPVSMAPPVDGGYQDVLTQSTADNEGADSVFLWSEVPSGQEVRITRAVFDRGGYQLYDDVGETIVVPFSNDNLYVMKFAVSNNGHMYFVDDNGTPVLYVPRNGYLENASVNGARWYPFTQDFHPSEPVYLGVAPSWHSYVTMGWYPDMYYTGGYWCHDPFIAGGIFEPAFGLEIVIGGNRFHGWTPYHNYYHSNPAPYHVGWYNRDRYTWVSQPHSNRHFWGGGNNWSRASRPVGPSSRWETSRVGRNGGSYRTYQSDGNHSWSNRNDHGWSGGSRQSGNGRTSDTHTWRNTTPSGSDWRNDSGGNHNFRGGTSGWSRSGGASTWSNGGGRRGDRQTGGGSSWTGSGGTSTWSNGGRGGDRQSGGGTSWTGSGGTSTWSNGGRRGDRQTGGGSSWTGSGGTSTWSNGGGSNGRGGDRQTGGGSSWTGRSGGSTSSGGNDRSSGGWSGGGRSGDVSSHTSGGGGGRWSR